MSSKRIPYQDHDLFRPEHPVSGLRQQPYPIPQQLLRHPGRLLPVQRNTVRDVHMSPCVRVWPPVLLPMENRERRDLRSKRRVRADSQTHSDSLPRQAWVPHQPHRFPAPHSLFRYMRLSRPLTKPKRGFIKVDPHGARRRGLYPFTELPKALHPIRHDRVRQGRQMRHGPYRHAPPFTPAPHPLRRMVGQRARDLFRSDAFRPEQQHRLLGPTRIQRLWPGAEKLSHFMLDKVEPCHRACSNQGPGNAPDSRTHIRPRPLHKPNACHAEPLRGPPTGT